MIAFALFSKFFLSDSEMGRDRHVQPILMNFRGFFIFNSYPPILTLKIPKIVSKNFFGALKWSKNQIQKFEFQGLFVVSPRTINLYKINIYNKYMEY